MQSNHLTTKIGQYAIILKDRKLLLLFPPHGPFWNFPGGRLNEDEDDCIIALKREIKEETGFTTSEIEPFHVSMWSVKGKSHRYAVFFLCKIENIGDEVKLSQEHDKYKWYTYEEAMNEKLMGKPGFEVFEKLHKKNLF